MRPLVASLCVLACQTPPDYAVRAGISDGAIGCGNGVLDPGETCDPGIAAGQPGACPVTCDDANSCTNDRVEGADCTIQCAHDSIPSCCGNGVVETGEACDDGNQTNFDGCSRRCVYERGLLIESMILLAGDQGCVLLGDGIARNALGGAMTAPTRAIFSSLISDVLQTCGIRQLAVLSGADPQMLASPFQCALLVGKHTDVTDTAFLVAPVGLDNNGDAQSTAPGQVSDAVTTIGPVTMTFPFVDCVRPQRWAELDVAPMLLIGTLAVNESGPTGFTGRFCAGLSAASLHRVPSGLGTGGASYLDAFAIGIAYQGYQVTATQPDIDVDSDGLERFIDTDGDANVDLCVDGNGVQIQGTACPLDPRIADAYSAAFDLEAAGTQLAGPWVGSWPPP